MRISSWGSPNAVSFMAAKPRLRCAAASMQDSKIYFSLSWQNFIKQCGAYVQILITIVFSFVPPRTRTLHTSTTIHELNITCSNHTYWRNKTKSLVCAYAWIFLLPFQYELLLPLQCLLQSIKLNKNQQLSRFLLDVRLVLLSRPPVNLSLLEGDLFPRHSHRWSQYQPVTSMKLPQLLYFLRKQLTFRNRSIVGKILVTVFR